MTVEPFRDGQGYPGARVRCDGCGETVEVRVQHQRTRTSSDHMKIHEGNLNRKLQAMGWSASGGKQTCPTCLAAKRVKHQEEPVMTASTPDIPQPSRDQKREIKAMLDEVYDTKAQRYRGEESDHTVADTLGIERWGWVTQIREDFFGPDGNEAKDNLIAEVRLKLRECDALGAKLHDEHDAIIKSLRDFNEKKTQLAQLLERLTAKQPAQKPHLVAR